LKEKKLNNYLNKIIKNIIYKNNIKKILQHCTSQQSQSCQIEVELLRMLWRMSEMTKARKKEGKKARGGSGKRGKRRREGGKRIGQRT
jgi:hypothetical protein